MRLTIVVVTLVILAAVGCSSSNGGGAAGSSAAGSSAAGSSAAGSKAAGSSAAGSSAAGHGGAGASGSGGASASGTATLSSLQTSLFGPSCATASCHDATTHQAGLALNNAATSCSQLVGVAVTEGSPTGPECRQGGALAAGMKRVVAGDQSKSFLYLKLTAPAECVTVGGMQAGERMPKDRPVVSAALVAAVGKWITGGASCD